MTNWYLFTLWIFSLACEGGCPKILILADGNFLAHLTRPLEIAKILQNRGYEIEFASSGKYENIVKKAGFKLLPVQPTNAVKIERICRNGFCNWFSAAELRDSIAEDRRVMNKSKPDLILTDFRLSALTSAELESVPHAMIINASWTNYFTGKLTAPDGFFLTKILGPRITNHLVPLLKEIILKHGVMVHNKVRKEFGLSKEKNLFDLFEQADLGLIADVPLYGPVNFLPNHYRYVGPLVWQPDLEIDLGVEKWDPTRPKAYVTMGSTGEFRYLQLAVEALENMNVQCLVSTGKLGKITPRLETTLVHEMLPGVKASEAVDFVVCQGGNGTLYQALRAGKPIIGIPVLHDQQFNMDQVVELGMGVSLRERGLTTKTIQTAVEQMLNSTSSNIELLRREFQKYRGPETAANQIEDFLKQK